ncbi:DUF4230 domain-containing protein [Hoylesella oralis]|uniref:DUF4230 domain-containing protein n=1 Tax=Hoylesella oralis TaxID=28134 RepID=UPI0028EB459F|nr:DUF4230 domain-containing protein [Hoylesella oralis]
MENNRNKLQGRLKRLYRMMPQSMQISIVAVVLIVLVGIPALVWLTNNNSIGITQNNRIDITPTQIRSIERIGEWEFLSISDEELVDTVRHGFFGDAQLVRIYYGTLRLGVNLHEAEPGWIKANKDTIVATLPPIKLLSNDFIDEARSRSFYESGSWTEASRDALYRKAYVAMKKRCLNSSNIAAAEQNATAQFNNLLRSMGFKFVHVKFENNRETKSKK